MGAYRSSEYFFLEQTLSKKKIIKFVVGLRVDFHWEDYRNRIGYLKAWLIFIFLNKLLKLYNLKKKDKLEKSALKRIMIL